MVWENIKINFREKSLKAPFAIYLDLECLLKETTSPKQFQRFVYRKPGIRFQAGKCLRNVRLMKNEISLIIRGEGIVLTIVQKVKKTHN